MSAGIAESSKEEREELDAMRAYDAEKAEPSQPIPFAQAVHEMDQSEAD